MSTLHDAAAAVALAQRTLKRMGWALLSAGDDGWYAQGPQGGWACAKSALALLEVVQSGAHTTAPGYPTPEPDVGVAVTSSAVPPAEPDPTHWTDAQWATHRREEAIAQMRCSLLDAHYWYRQARAEEARRQALEAELRRLRRELAQVQAACGYDARG